MEAKCKTTTNPCGAGMITNTDPFRSKVFVYLNWLYFHNDKICIASNLSQVFTLFQLCFGPYLLLWGNLCLLNVLLCLQASH